MTAQYDQNMEARDRKLSMKIGHNYSIDSAGPCDTELNTITYFFT